MLIWGKPSKSKFALNSIFTILALARFFINTVACHHWQKFTHLYKKIRRQCRQLTSSVRSSMQQIMKSHRHILTKRTLASKISKQVRNFRLHVIPSGKENASEKILPVTFAGQVCFNSINNLTGHLHLQWLQTVIVINMHQSVSQCSFCHETGTSGLFLTEKLFFLVLLQTDTLTAVRCIYKMITSLLHINAYILFQRILTCLPLN